MKLDNKEGSDHYYINNPRFFKGTEILQQEFQQVLDFAYSMCFGDGHHRNSRSGGQYARKNGEKFCHTFQGKLAELVLYNYFTTQGLHCKEPDFGIHAKGIWDDCDLEIKNKKINVKSVAFLSNLLLLEAKDWNEKGQYIPNSSINSNATTHYDYFVLVRIQPDIKKIFNVARLMFCNEIKKESIQELIFGQYWSFDIAGYSTNNDLIDTITNGFVLPQNAILNLYTKMDAQNYYIQSGSMRLIANLVQELNSI